MLQRLRAAVRWAPARCSLQAECEPEWTALQRLLQARVHVRSEGAPEEAASTGIPDTLPLAGKDTDWREFRARLVASQVRGRLALDLKPGCWEAALPEQCECEGSRVHAADFTRGWKVALLCNLGPLAFAHIGSICGVLCGALPCVHTSHT